jgi:hypothetical protein
MLIGNFTPDILGVGTTYVYSPSEAATGSSFNLHELKAKAQKILLDPTSLRFGHFHDQSHVDIFVVDLWRIYWADDSGNYDSTRYTNLSVNVQGDYQFGGYYRNSITPYCTHLTSDTVDDLVLGFYTVWNDETKDTMFVALFRGGTNLMSKMLSYEDTSAMTYPIEHIDAGQDYLVSSQGDFRGVGRSDLIVKDEFANLWYYKNDPPFSIGALAQAITQDTLLIKWQNPNWVQHGDANATETGYFSMRAMPKSVGDNSVDFMPVLTTTKNPNGAIYIFRGGSDFGSKRLIIDSADFVIQSPEPGNSEFAWPDFMIDAGDMTGTGNRVLYVAANDDVSAYQDFYVTGQALDSKIDIYTSFSAGALGDTLTANGDSLEDFLMGLPGYVSVADQSDGKSSVGSLWLMYGSKNIPVRLNPQWADVVNIPQQNGAGITLSPNPANGWSLATIIWPEAEDGEYSIYDMLGRKIEHGPIRLLGGAEQQRIYFSGMPQGVYVYVIEGAHGSASARFVKLGGASSGSGSSQPSIIQQMKDARDGKSDPAGLSSPSLLR